MASTLSVEAVGAGALLLRFAYVPPPSLEVFVEANRGEHALPSPARGQSTTTATGSLPPASRRLPPISAPNSGSTAIPYLGTTQIAAGGGDSFTRRNDQNVPAVSSQPINPLPSANEGQQPDGFFGESSTYNFVSRVRSSSPEGGNGNAPSKSKRRRISASHDSNATGLLSVLTPLAAETAQELPPRPASDDLIDAYFNRVHRLYPFIHESTFRSEYEQMWIHPPVSTRRPTWLALLNMVYSFGWEFGENWNTRNNCSAYTFAARAQNLLYPHMLPEASLEIVQTLLLLCHFLQGTLEVNTCWSLVGLMTHSAISIGLHLNPTTMALTSVEKEVRKRVWWGCIMLDRTLGMKFGRPPFMRTTDGLVVDHPAEVDDQYITNDGISPRQPIGRPSLTAFFVHTLKLAPIIERILQELYHSGASRPFQKNGNSGLPASATNAQILGTTVAIDGRLSEWWRTGPSHLTREAQPGDYDSPELHRQRLVLSIRYHHVRLLVHRQSFLLFGRHQVDDSFLTSVAAASASTCVAAARRAVQLICSRHNRRRLNSLWYNLHYIFTATGVLLCLKTMELAHFEGIGVTPDDETLEMGMEFLADASHNSPLAARYNSMLKHIHDHVGRSDVNGMIRPNTRFSTPNLSGTGTDEPSAFMIDEVDNQNGLMRGLQDTSGIFDLDFVDFNDLFLPSAF
ncbi:hypothetical protein LTR47_011108 [Exophiala xenobiotica]|nr:hypothetical protein LTR47_011108 [Exophiala xenobiotica]KAK5357868.1 hypothetical protein LTR11_011186 [Exophiala xenobiotica]KAK5358772.1 hypothetical protein LTS03_011177 [Exophiala xenobiotica]